MPLLTSILSVVALAAVHVTVGRWRWLYRSEHSPWLSVSAGTAVAYVFVYLLPKLEIYQQKLDSVFASSGWQPLISTQIYLIALCGLVAFYWLGWLEERIHDDSIPARGSSPQARVLHIGGYGAYSLQMGFLMGSNADAGVPVHVIAVVVLGLHLMGVDYGIRKAHTAEFDARLRWVFAAALILGWGLAITADTLETLIMLWSAFIGGGIIVTALREELPGYRAKRFAPFLLGVIGATVAILVVQVVRH